MRPTLLLALLCTLGCTDAGRLKLKHRRRDEGGYDSYLEVFSCTNPLNKHIHVFTHKLPKPRYKHRRPTWRPRYMKKVTPNVTDSSGFGDKEDVDNRILYIGGERIEASQHFRISDMTYEVCEGSEEDPVTIKSMELLEDAVLPGDMHVAFNIHLSEDLEDGIEADVEAYKQILGAYIPMPCYNHLGSCNYEDICEASHYGDKCPKDFRRDDIPCTCPISKGTYRSQDLKVYAAMTDIEDIPSWLTDGHYMAEITFRANGKRLTCIKAEINVEKTD